MPQTLKTRYTSKTPHHKIYRKFRLSVIFWRHPERMFIWLAAMFLFTPDMARYLGPYIQNEYLSITSTIWVGSFALFFAGPIIMNFIEYKRYPVMFYDDHLRIRNSLFIRENLVIPYKSVRHVENSSSLAQKLNRLETVKLQLRTSNDDRRRRDYSFEVEDLKKHHLSSRHINDMISLGEKPEN